MARPFPAVAVVLLSLAPLYAALSQRPAGELERPALDSAGDTNSAADYYQFGLNALDRKPKDAERAFYWARRLDPRLAEPYYAQRIAWFYAHKNLYLDYLRGRKGAAKNPELIAHEALVGPALLRDPFVRPRLDGYVIPLLYKDYLSFVLSKLANARVSGWIDLANGEYSRAAAVLASGILADSATEDLHALRASAFFHLGEMDSTVAELQKAINAREEREKVELVMMYQGKAMYEYAIGHALLKKHDLDGAKEAYGRAASEDLSFYMAHARLAVVASLQNDTATATNEFETAVQIEGKDAMLRYDYAIYLIQIGKYEDAVAQLDRGVEAEPYFAQLYLALGVVHTTLGNDDKARAAFQAFLDRAARNDPARERVKKQLTELKGSPL